MNVYIYAADIYCEDCGKAIRKQIGREGLAPKVWNDESSYDSDEFPKGPYPDGGGEADYSQHCGSGPQCVNAIELAGGDKIGAWLENELTVEGVEYVCDAIREGGEVARMWAEFYCDYPAIQELNKASAPTDDTQKRIGEFELIIRARECPQPHSMGVEAVTSQFSNATSGVGVTPVEAVDNCLEQVVRAGFDTEGVRMRVLQLCWWEEVVTTSTSRVKGGCYHVSILWNKEMK